MKRYLLYSIILLSPIVGMIFLNEWVRIRSNENGYEAHGTKAINSDQKLTSKCSWACHNNTNYCKQNHVKLAKPYFHQIDSVYFGIIRFLKSTGNYGLANIVFLVVLIPIVIYTILIKIINIQLKINHLRKQQEA